MTPPDRVLDLFAVPPDPRPLEGGQGRSVLAGDLVLSPGRDAATQQWLAPLLARLAVSLDQDPRRRRLDLRVAMPVPARDGSWVVDGWAASRWEPGTVVCEDLAVTRAAGRLLHSKLATAVTATPAGRTARTDRWARAEAAAFDEDPVGAAGGCDAELVGLVGQVADLLHGADPVPGGDQLVHADLAGNVLLDAAGAPVVIDVSPAWRPAGWADAVCVLDSVLWFGADRGVLTEFVVGGASTAMLRAVLFRLLSDDPPDLDAYAGVLAALG